MPYSVEGLGLSGEASLPRFGRISCAESLRLMSDAVFCRRAWTERGGFIAKIRENFLCGIAAAYARCRILSQELDRMVEGPS